MCPRLAYNFDLQKDQDQEQISGLRLTSPIIKKKFNRMQQDSKEDIPTTTDQDPNASKVTAKEAPTSLKIASVSRKHRWRPGAVSREERDITPVRYSVLF